MGDDVFDQAKQDRFLGNQRFLCTTCLLRRQRYVPIHPANSNTADGSELFLVGHDLVLVTNPSNQMVGFLDDVLDTSWIEFGGNSVTTIPSEKACGGCEEVVPTKSCAHEVATHFLDELGHAEDRTGTFEDHHSTNRVFLISWLSILHDKIFDRLK